MQKEKMIRMIRWCLVAIWMLVIFNFSAQTAVESSALSGGIVDRMMEVMETFYHQILGEVWHFPRKTLVFVVRKGAHMSVYFVLAILIYGAWHPATSNRSKNIKTLLLCILYAVSDECHQGFVPGRSAEFRDVCVDTAGAILGLLAVMVIFYGVRRRHQKAEPCQDREVCDD